MSLFKIKLIYNRKVQKLRNDILRYQENVFITNIYLGKSTI